MRAHLQSVGTNRIARWRKDISIRGIDKSAYCKAALRTRWDIIYLKRLWTVRSEKREAVDHHFIADRCGTGIRESPSNGHGTSRSRYYCR